MVKDIPFSNLHVFPYSPRPHTPAARMSGQVPTEDKKQRSAELIELGRKKKHAFAQQFLERDVSVLVERLDKRGTARGWTGEYLEARVQHPPAGVNQIVKFRPVRLVDGALCSR